MDKFVLVVAMGGDTTRDGEIDELDCRSESAVG